MRKEKAKAKKVLNVCQREKKKGKNSFYDVKLRRTRVEFSRSVLANKRRVFQRDRGCITYESMGARDGPCVCTTRATQPAQRTCSTISSVTAAPFIKSPRIGANSPIRRKLEPPIFTPTPKHNRVHLLVASPKRIRPAPPCFIIHHRSRDSSAQTYTRTFHLSRSLISRR